VAKRKVFGLGAAKFLAVAAVLLAACGYNVSNPRPVLNSISPTSAPAGSAGFMLTVGGRNFVSGSSVVEWNGGPRTTIFVSGSQLQATINPSDLALAGAAAVTVFTQSPGGGVSSQATFTIASQPSPVPAVTSISPATAFAGGPSFTLTVNGTNFVSGSTVLWNGGNRATTFFNSTLLAAAITSTDIQTAGTAQVPVVGQVAVLNPLPGGGASNTKILNINNPVPQVATFSPATTAAGTPAFTLTVNGTGFACAQFTTSGGTTTCSTPASTVNWNGSPRTTTFVTTAQLTASIGMADIAAAEIVPVSVTNSAPGGGTSSPTGYPIIPGSNGAGLPELVDVSNNGVEAANGIGSVSGPGPTTAGNGRFIVFASDSSNLVPNDFNGAADVFLRDTCLGMTSNCVPVTTLVSVSADGITSGNGPSSEPSISSNGRFVVFSSSATNLISPSLPAGTPQQVYLRDTCIGATSCTPATTLVSVAPDGKTPSDGASSQPAISSDGRFIAFTTTASNLGPSNPGHAQEIFLRDTCQGVASGCTASTILVSTPDGSTLADGVSSQATIAVASSGQFIAFSSTATNLAAGATGTQEIYQRATCVGISSGCTAATILISTPDSTTPPTTLANGASGQPSISSDGRFVAFASTATNLGTNPGGFQQIYLRDTCTGATGCTAGTKLVSIASDGVSPGGGDSSQPQVSSSGRFVAFDSAASNLVATDSNNLADVFVRDTCATVASGCTATTALASVAADGTTQGNGASLAPAISSDGHFVVFLSEGSNSQGSTLVSNDTNTAPIRDVFLAISHF
jgi:trimeric autotransporter adhesin